MKTYQEEVKFRTLDLNQKQQSARSTLKKIGSNAKAEQQKIYQDSMAGGMMSLITGAGQGVSGAFAIASADQLEEAANRMKDIENTQVPVPNFTPLGPTAAAPSDALAPGNGQTITGQTEAPSQQASNDEGGVPDLGGLGKPLGTEQPNNINPNGPAPGGFQAGGPSSGGGGSGGGMGGGGSVGTGAATADQGEPQAKMADGSKGAGYDGGGGYGGGGAGSGAASNGPDLSGLLAQFLPKKEDEQKNPNGILDFGGRNPAAEGPISLLDRNANIFDRIHETYQDKNRKGKVGI